jgi:hypothetical protein
MIGSELKAQAVESLIADWNRDYDPGKTSLILAHLRRDVRMLNEHGPRYAGGARHRCRRFRLQDRGRAAQLRRQATE